VGITRTTKGNKDNKKKDQEDNISLEWTNLSFFFFSHLSPSRF